MKKLLIEGGEVVNQGRRFVGYVVVQGERIVEVGQGEYGILGAENKAETSSSGYRKEFDGERIDARGMLVLPGVIDDQVHFREPGLTHKGDIRSESRAAVAGGVTSYMEMPNTNPATVTIDDLEQKFEIASRNSMANYSFYFGATNNNIEEIAKLKPERVCGVKVFMGSSTGDMLVDNPKALAAIFATSPILIATHCEEERIIRDNLERFKAKFGDKIEPAMHPMIRSAEACYRSSARAVELADRYGSELHVLHLSTGRELSLFDSKPLKDKLITNEVCLHHLWFSDRDYAKKGNLIKWNPAIKSMEDRDALREGLLRGKVDIVATDHAPHTREEKSLKYLDAPSGGPLVQHSLVGMLELSRQGVMSVETVVEKMCHAPAVRFKVEQRGFIREGGYADIVVVNPNSEWRVERENILSKCGWSPFEGEQFQNKVEYTLVNGSIVYKRGEIDEEFRGAELKFNR